MRDSPFSFGSMCDPGGSPEARRTAPRAPRARSHLREEIGGVGDAGANAVLGPLVLFELELTSRDIQTTSKRCNKTGEEAGGGLVTGVTRERHCAAARRRDSPAVVAQRGRAALVSRSWSDLQSTCDRGAPTYLVGVVCAVVVRRRVAARKAGRRRRTLARRDAPRVTIRAHL